MPNGKNDWPIFQPIPDILCLDKNRPHSILNILLLMKKLLLLLVFFLVFSNSFAQKTELRIALNSGLFSFTGESAQSNTSINYSDQNNSGYTNNPYGSKSELSYGLSGNVRRVTKKYFILGLDLGYERLSGKITINKINGFTGNSTYQYDASGKTHLNFHVINLNPYLGHRFNFKQISLDATGGFDVGYILSAIEKGSAKDMNGREYTTSIDRKTINLDVRPRVQLAINYQKAGIYAGYSYGFINYKREYVGGTNECRSRMLRFGITYQLN